MVTRDEAVEALRRARPADPPDDVGSATSDTARAILQEVLSMSSAPTSTTGGTAARPADDAGPGRFPAGGPPLAPHRASRGRRRLAALAAAVVAVAGAAVVLDGSRDDDALRSDAAMEAQGPSGRLEVAWELSWGMVPPGARSVTLYEFSGDRLRRSDPPGDGGEPVPSYIQVGDQAWSRWAPAGHGEPEAATWRESEVGGPGPATLDPATLLDRWAAAGPFEPVGREDVDGVPTTRRQAAAPGAIEGADLHLTPYFPSGAVSRLEAWVDDAGVVRRLVVGLAGEEQGAPFSEAYTLTFSDLGEPIAIEPPASAEGPPPLGTDPAAPAPPTLG